MPRIEQGREPRLVEKPRTCLGFIIAVSFAIVFWAAVAILFKTC